MKKALTQEQIDALTSDDPAGHDEEMKACISSLKEFSFVTKLRKSKIDSELGESIERVTKDLDETFHEEIDPLLERIAREQKKIKEIQEKS